MAYVIRYQKNGKKKYPRRNLRLGDQIPIVFCLCAILTVVAISVAYGSLYWLVPGDPDVTVPAFCEFMDAISQGDPFGDAVSAFCREVILGGT